VKKTLILTMAALLGLGLWAVAGFSQVSVSVLDVPPGVQALGEGGAAVSLADGAETLYYNPAGLSALPGVSFSSFYARYLGMANYSAFTLAFRNWAVGFLMLDSGDIQGYDESGEPTDTLSYGSNAILFGFGLDSKGLPYLRSLPLSFSLGGRLKYVTESVGTADGGGFSFDLAYRMTFPNLSLGPIGLSDMAIGVTATNLFGSVSFGSHGEAMGMDLSLGASARIAKVVLLTTDFDLGKGAIHAGVAYEPVRDFTIRTGVFTQPGGMSFTIGLGVNVQGFVIDYAFITHPTLPGTHRISLSINFSGIDIPAFGRLLRGILP
jgi:hypothetical protein